MEDFILIFNIFFYFLSYKFKYKKYLLFSFQTKRFSKFFLKFINFYKSKFSI